MTKNHSYQQDYVMTNTWWFSVWAGLFTGGSIALLITFITSLALHPYVLQVGGAANYLNTVFPVFR